jgi:hypothetical protein
MMDELMPFEAYDVDFVVERVESPTIDCNRINLSIVLKFIPTDQIIKDSTEAKDHNELFVLHLLEYHHKIL